MLINQEQCVGCGQCVPYCPMNALVVRDRKINLNREECVECGVCLRSNVCPCNVFVKETLAWPRSIRAVFSDPLNIHKETNMAGRGTSEMKTNDVTGRFQDGEAGVALEAGRPGVGTRFTDIQKLTRALVARDVRLEPLNPLTKFIDPVTGDVNAEILHEKVMSAVVECSVPESRVLDVIATLRDVEGSLETVVSVALAVRSRNGNFDDACAMLDTAGLYHRPNGKLNVGLGKPRYEEKEGN